MKIIYLKAPPRGLRRQARLNRIGLIFLLAGAFLWALPLIFSLPVFWGDGSEKIKGAAIRWENTRVKSPEIKAQSQSKSEESIVETFSLSIPRLGLVNIPVFANVVSLAKEDYLSFLEKGVAHFAGSALPGEEGNVFLYGHSSLPVFYNPKDYKTIFTRLPDLKRGDLINLRYAEKLYTYQVRELRTVSPDEISALENGKEQTLTLMTCVPLGTTLKRLLVVAQEIA